MRSDQVPIQQRKTAVTHTTTDAYPSTGVAATTIDTGDSRATFVGYRIEETGDSNNATVKLQASLDGDTWVDLTARDETGSAQGAAEVTVTANTDEYLFVTPEHDSGVLAAFRFYRLNAKAASAGNQADLSVDVFAK